MSARPGIVLVHGAWADGSCWTMSSSGCRPTAIAEAAVVAGVKLDIKGGRHCTASQLLAGGFDLRNTAARLGRSGGGATTLRHYAGPVPEVDRRAAAYLAKLTARATARTD